MPRTISRKRQSATEFQQKILEITQINVNAAYEWARALAGVSSLSEFVEVCLKHSRRQIQATLQHTTELAVLAQNAAVESMRPFGSLFHGTALGRPDLSRCRE